MGYHGTIEVDTSDYSLHGSILFIDEKFVYSGQTFEELEYNFQNAVKNHIHLCRQQGQEPPFSDELP